MFDVQVFWCSQVKNVLENSQLIAKVERKNALKSGLFVRIPLFCISDLNDDSGKEFVVVVGFSKP